MQLGMLLICAHARNRPAKREQYLKLFATAVHKKIVMRRARIARESLTNLPLQQNFACALNLRDRENPVIYHKEIKRRGGVFLIYDINKYGISFLVLAFSTA
jgi:hypothetical protein